ncbi:MAG: FAD-dependent oxidoreductase [Motiliproteus sp.]
MENLEADIAIIGAGVVGVCCAITLQQAGLRVALIDRDGISEGCSKGNAGHFATEQVLPLATPGLLWKIPGMLLDPLGPVAIRWPYLPRIAPWLMQFMLNTRKAPFEQGADALTSLNEASLPAWLRLLQQTGAEDQLKIDGSVLVFEKDQSFKDYQTTRETLTRHGVNSALLSGDQVREMEPHLSAGIRHGVFFPDTGHTANPHRLTKTLADFFVSNGGRFVQQPVSDLRTLDGGVAFQMGDSQVQVPKLVLATGAWSRSLVKQLTHTSIPLDTERGYHLMLPNDANQLRLPVSSADRRFIMSPMDEGLRLAGTVEFGGLELPANMERAKMLSKHARALLPSLDNTQGECWMGFRPSLPDSLPVIDRVGPQGQVLLAFGHQHLGLTQAALTAELIRDLAHAETPDINLEPFSLGRF